ncbi:MAG: hypothetical protein V1716_05705 [Candidatus Uhrbacteria bacterium]
MNEEETREVPIYVRGTSSIHPKGILRLDHILRTDNAPEIRLEDIDEEIVRVDGRPVLLGMQLWLNKILLAPNGGYRLEWGCSISPTGSLQAIKVALEGAKRTGLPVREDGRALVKALLGLNTFRKARVVAWTGLKKGGGTVTGQLYSSGFGTTATEKMVEEHNRRMAGQHPWLALIDFFSFGFLSTVPGKVEMPETDPWETPKAKERLEKTILPQLQDRVNILFDNWLLEDGKLRTQIREAGEDLPRSGQTLLYDSKPRLPQGISLNDLRTRVFVGNEPKPELKP